MNFQLRIPRATCDQMRADFRRLHSVASERVGFCRIAVGSSDQQTLLFATSYWPVADDQYVDDPDVGARINTIAIRSAMQDILAGSHGLLHVHLHDRIGRTGLSRTDIAEIPKLVASFQNVAIDRPHGFLVLSSDHALSFVNPPRTKALVPVNKISIVGYPLEVLT